MEEVNGRLVMITDDENVLVAALYFKCCVIQSSAINIHKFHFTGLARLMQGLQNLLCF